MKKKNSLTSIILGTKSATMAKEFRFDPNSLCQVSFGKPKKLGKSRSFKLAQLSPEKLSRRKEKYELKQKKRTLNKKRLKERLQKMKSREFIPIDSTKFVDQIEDEKVKIIGFKANFFNLMKNDLGKKVVLDENIKIDDVVKTLPSSQIKEINGHGGNVIFEQFEMEMPDDDEEDDSYKLFVDKFKSLMDIPNNFTFKDLIFKYGYEKYDLMEYGDGYLIVFDIHIIPNVPSGTKCDVCRSEVSWSKLMEYECFNGPLEDYRCDYCRSKYHCATLEQIEWELDQEERVCRTSWCKNIVDSGYLCTMCERDHEDQQRQQYGYMH